jgi:succinate dehydrogenase hydrophobic membrane anchor protein
MMVLGNQTVSPVFYWLCLLIISTGLSYIVAARIWQTKNSAAWKFQRISGSFLALTIPAHLLFMHLQPSVGHDAVLIIARMQNIFVKFIDGLLVMATLYHGGYGLLSIAKDYIPSRGVQKACTFFIFIVMVSFAWIAVKLLMAV